MSGVGLVLSAVELAALQQAFIKPQRSLGGIFAHVTLKEQHTDAVTFTEHPVERGASISDHAYKQPERVTLTLGWSNSPPGGLIFGRSGDASPVTAPDAYDALLQMQSVFSLIDVVTGKRKYADMAIETIEVETDPESENILLVTVACRQILFATANVVTLGPGTGARQAEPQSTGPVLNAGERRLQSAPYWKN